MAGGVFHVEFGINDTILTRALENKQYSAAETIIRENTNPSYLDEGCYQRTPLFICLCGIDEEQQSVRPRNLFLARLLVENGANVNYRVPMTYGSEFEGPGKSPLELLTDFYNDLTKLVHPHSKELWSAHHSQWDLQNDVVIGLNKQYLTTPQEVTEHVEDLIFIIISHGGDINIYDEMKMTPLHRTATSSIDTHLFKLLCDNGANINALDCRGNSPLLAMCDVAVTDDYDFFEDWSTTSDDTYEETSAGLCVQHQFLDYMLLQKNIQVNISNNRGQTALFHCVLRGDISACQKLLRSGADPAIRGIVWESRKRKRKLSPIFVSFLSIPLQRMLGFQNSHHLLAQAPRQYAHLVDAGYFSRKEITEEVKELLDNEFPEFDHLKVVSDKLVRMMCGRSTAGLRQLATRTIFQQVFLQSTKSLGKLLPSSSLQSCLKNADLRQMDVYDEYINLVLNRTVLQALIVRLGLPSDSLINFEVELLLYQMASRFSGFKILPPESMYNEDSGESSLSEDSELSTSQDEGDSDLEYW
uniref:Uncharacterized protein LOC111101404 n=1 Tax=Crassostrea virginica TaxID=6565 RepID=A0A8B8AHJ5_CRAVI|nr:uncharacterized protein LOC111101404 [Crassostrea virginica]XP_022289586.1 uncharacterized protein LOC111101404 [Crassostrea virginica]XP_022290650.1 uncharacterized protein LOC111102275 [Crassostrea virginica]XP_022290652.1 uncharacterized protein LOC111102275 [Crassostrea virginica]